MDEKTTLTKLLRAPMKARWLFLQSAKGRQWRWQRALFLFFLALCRTENWETWEFKGRRFTNSQRGDSNDKLAFLSNNTKHLKCLSTQRVGEIRDCPCYVLLKTTGTLRRSKTASSAKRRTFWPSVSLRLTETERFFRSKYRVLRHAQNKEQWTQTRELFDGWMRTEY